MIRTSLAKGYILKVIDYFVSVFERFHNDVASWAISPLPTMQNRSKYPVLPKYSHIEFFQKGFPFERTALTFLITVVKKWSFTYPKRMVYYWENPVVLKQIRRFFYHWDRLKKSIQFSPCLRRKMFKHP